MVSGRQWYGATETAGDALETTHEAVSGVYSLRGTVPRGFSRCFR